MAVSTMTGLTSLAVAVLVSALLFGCYAARYDGEAIRLEGVKVLTLRHGEMTNARRSPAVPQLKCVGGTAGCDTFRPQVVQCYNRGSDGYDVQWECKTDMDNAYRFGKVQVSCEGYDYSDDPSILKGSCGLEYTLDLTTEGQQQRAHHGDHQYYGKQHQHDYHDRSQYEHSTGYGKKATSVLGDLMYLAIIGVFIYIIYVKCIAAPVHSDDPPAYDDTFRQAPPRGSQPPPYGFRQDHMPKTGDGSYSGGATHSTHTNAQPGTATGGGFWSGAMTGGLLGYLFGNRNNYGYAHHHPRQGWGTGWGNGGGWGTGWGTGGGLGSGWGSNTRSTYSSSTPSPPRSSGTRTASGFGGTTRR